MDKAGDTLLTSQHHYKTNTLCQTIVPLLLREIAKYYLTENKISLQNKLESISKNELNSDNIKAMKQSCDLEKYDITKLNILLRGFHLDNDDFNNLKRFRECRNAMDHLPSAELDDEEEFKEKVKLLKKWARSFDSKAKKSTSDMISLRIEELKSRRVYADNLLKNKLRQRLTRGNKYVTDVLFPVFLLGSRSNSPSCLQRFNIDVALKSSRLVLDFDSRITLLEEVVECDGKVFEAKTAVDLKGDIGSYLEHPTWIFCNGNPKSSDKKEKESMEFKRWKKERASALKDVLSMVKKEYSNNCLVIFIVFEDLTVNDPSSHIAHYIVDDLSYPDEIDCIIISESDSSVHNLEKKLREGNGLDQNDLDDLFISGLPFDIVSKEMQILFKVNKDLDCVLPCSNGSKVVMTKMERSAFKNIDIISGEECSHEYEKMTENERKTIMKELRTDFYRGMGISWWNFYFEGQVGKRKILDGLCRDISNKITTGKNVQPFCIGHYPGAGGTTLGMNIVWKFSQFQSNMTPAMPYRSCKVKTVTENTAQEIEDLYYFNEKGDSPRPIIVFVDDVQDDPFNDLFEHLFEKCVKRKAAGLSFLLLRMKRVQINQATGCRWLLSSKLQEEEKMWFKVTYRELKKKHDDEYLKSLISFNCLKKSYSPKVLSKTTNRYMTRVKPDEKKIMKCLCVIRSYERKRHAVPIRIFDVFFKHHENRTWNTHMSEAMDLLVHQYEDEKASGVSVISQPLAKAILEYFVSSEGLQFQSLVEFLLDLVEKTNSSKVGSYMTTRLKSIVADLFKREKREEKPVKETTIEVRADSQKKHMPPFAKLIRDLHKQKQSETTELARERVVKHLERCYKLTQDLFVGQQLARYFYYILKFQEAEKVIKECRATNSNNSYLCDTHGVIFKSNTEYLIEKYGKGRDATISDKHAAEIITMAFKAFEKFIEGQELAIQEKPLAIQFNTSSFENEIRTAINLLGSFLSFECFAVEKGNEMFHKFLNDPMFEIERSHLKGLVEICPLVLELRQNYKSQRHLRDTLQRLRDWFTQIKHYTVLKTEQGKIVLTLNERLEMFYKDETYSGNCRLFCSIDLPAIMENWSKTGSIKDTLSGRVRIAKQNLENGHRNDTRDLLLYLGNSVVELSYKSKNVTEKEYEKLLFYSSELINSELTIPGERLLLDIFLYFSLFHWPTKSRTEKNFDIFCSPTKFTSLLKKWEKRFYSNHKLVTKQQKEKNMPKTIFAIGKGTPGNDIINTTEIRRQLKEKKTTDEQLPSGDELWDEPMIKEILESFRGVVNKDGTSLFYKVEYPGNRERDIEIGMYKHQTDLSHREVTFFLGLSWRGPTALGVKTIDHSSLQMSPRIDENTSPEQVIGPEKLSQKLSPLKPDTRRTETLHGRHVAVASSTESSNTHNQSQIVRVKTNAVKKPILVEDVELSKTIAQSLEDNPPLFIVAVHICRNVSGGKKQLCLLMLHIPTVNKETYVYHFNAGKHHAIVDGELGNVLKMRETVWYDIESAAICLVEDCDVLLDKIWDIKILLNHVTNVSDEDKEYLTQWDSNIIENGKKLASGDPDDSLLWECLQHAELIAKVYDICKREIDEKVTCSQVWRNIRKETFAWAQLPNVKEKIQLLKKREKRERQKKVKGQAQEHQPDQLQK